MHSLPKTKLNSSSVFFSSNFPYCLNSLTLTFSQYVPRLPASPSLITIEFEALVVSLSVRRFVLMCKILHIGHLRVKITNILDYLNRFCCQFHSLQRSNGLTCVSWVCEINESITQTRLSDLVSDQLATF